MILAVHSGLTLKHPFDDNNYIDIHKTQKIKVKNECEIEHQNQGHNNDNVNITGFEYSNNTSESLFEMILVKSTDGAQPVE